MCLFQRFAACFLYLYKSNAIHASEAPVLERGAKILAVKQFSCANAAALVRVFLLAIATMAGQRRFSHG